MEDQREVQNPELRVLKNIATFRILSQSDILFPLASAVVDIEFSGEIAHFNMLSQNRFCVLVGEIKENEIGSYCQIVSEVRNSQTDTPIAPQGKLRLVAKAIDRVRIVNTKVINASENERFSRSVLGPLRENFPVSATDCQIFKDSFDSNSLDDTSRTELQGRITEIIEKTSGIVHKLKQRNYGYFIVLSKFKALGYIESQENIRASPAILSTLSLNLASILKLDDNEKKA